MKRLEESELSRPPSKVLEILCKLGKGSYGSVFKARHKLTGSIVAVKKVPVDSDLSEIVKEISIMQQCDSPYIVKCHGSLFDNQDLWICMEYCGAGSVADIMRLRNQTLKENEIGTILKYSLLGLDYLHQMRKIHRDIKSGNILLTNTGMAKLADFGVAGQLADTLAKRNTVIGTPYWMAPEVIQEVGYNCSADIWSLGITAIEMGDGKPPLGDEHPMRALFMIPSQPSPHLRSEAAWSPAFVSFVNSCLARLPDARPSAADLLATDFVCNSKPCAILLPLIEESNAIREKRLADANSGSSSTRASAALVRSGSGVAVLDSNDRRQRRRLPNSEVVDIVDTNQSDLPRRDGTGTMIQRPDSGGNTDSENMDEANMQGTLISLNSNGSSNDSRRRGLRNSDFEDSLGGTMVINDSADFEEDNDRDSVVVHDTASLKQQSDNVAVAGGGGDTLTRNFGQLAINESSQKWSEQEGSLELAEDTNAAAAVAAAQRDCGMVVSDGHGSKSPPLQPHNPVAQRPFAPFSRAFQEMGGGDNVSTPNALALVNEPGGLSRLNYSELEQLLVNLGHDLETELRNLAVRYRHKRQPLLDAIAEKTAVTTGITSFP